jgi:NAD(P)-dependent dehydrogenase (short-subunit alcohol dehydrogenase family)
VEIGGKVAVVTGAASGIGEAIAVRLANGGARGVAVLDRNGEGAARVAESLRGGVGTAVEVDVTDEAAVRGAVSAIEGRWGPVDVCFANAGVIGRSWDEADDDVWAQLWAVHVMAHVYLVRALLPGMRARGSGYFVHTASAAGVLTALGDAPYSTTKAATVALAEWLAITYRDDGIRVSCLCPQGVETAMFDGARDQLTGQAVLAGGPLLDPTAVADAVIDAIAEERFFVLPHPEVADYVRRKAADPDRWLFGMARLQARIKGADT